MKTNWALTASLMLVLSAWTLAGQEKAVKPARISTGTYHGVSSPVWSMPVITEQEYREMEMESMEKRLNESLEEESLLEKEGIKSPLAWRDPVLQDFEGKTMTAQGILRNVDGISSPYWPTDDNGEAGNDFYVQTVNAAFAIYNKAGDRLAGPINIQNLFISLPGGNCNSGDPIVLYDDQADRWLLAQFSLCNANDLMHVAVSTTPDPRGTWHIYSFEVDDIPDYEKFGVWRDGYYMGTNTVYKIAGVPYWDGTDVYVMERSQMLSGGSAQMVAFDNPWPTTTSEMNLVLPADNDGPFAPIGSPGIFVTFKDDTTAANNDQLWIYELAVNWTNPASSTFSRVQQLPVASFDSRFTQGISQPGSTYKLDLLAHVVMHKPQYRNFGSYQTLVLCHTVDVNGSNRAGIRWYELRKTGANWVVRQQGTYSPDNTSRWMGSIALNGHNEIALGYSVSSSTVYPGIRYCAQSASAYNSANSIMDIPENTIYTGQYSQWRHLCCSNRWGDYSAMSVDPLNDEVFWYTAQYAGPEEERHTRIASFQIGSASLAADFAASDLDPRVNQGVFLTDLTVGSPVSWNWTITPNTLTYVSGTGPTSQNPVVRFNTGGYYDIKLKVSDGSSTDSITRTNYIKVCGINTLPIGEDFSALHLADCWTQWDSSGSSTWTFENLLSRTLYSSTSYNGFILIDGDLGMGSYSAFETPSLNFTGYNDIYLYFMHYFEKNFSYDGYARVDYSTDGGINWTPLAIWYSTTSNPNVYNLDVTPFVGGFSSAKIRWVYYSEIGDGCWLIDDIWITGTATAAPIANFYSEQTRPEINQPVNLVDFSSNSPYTWNWSFSPSSVTYLNGTTSTSRFPVVSFNNGGYYNVTLEAGNTIGTDSEIKNNYIYAETPGLWKGFASNDWNASNNWDNHAVPDGNLDVIIPSSATHWPVFTGDFALGGNCRDLTMKGASSFTTEGFLFILPQRKFKVDSTGQVRIRDNFYDYGEFDPGMGTLEFFGDNSSTVWGTEINNVDINQYIRHTFTKGMTYLSAPNAGPTGDDGFQDAPIGFDFHYAGTLYQNIRISTNGWASLDQSGSTHYDNAFLFTADVPNTTLAPWWDDLRADGTGQVFYKTEGSAPNRVFIVEWKNILTYYTGATTRISFQLKLFETTNIIEFHYGNWVTGTSSPSESASIGLEDQFGGQGNFIEATTGSMNFGVTNLDHYNWPAVNYRFTPPPVESNFYHLHLNKTSSSVLLNRTINVQQSIVIEPQTQLIVPASKMMNVTGGD